MVAAMPHDVAIRHPEDISALCPTDRQGSTTSQVDTSSRYHADFHGDGTLEFFNKLCIEFPRSDSL
jgi:hypothetical protein